jgi:hypothetical protein
MVKVTMRWRTDQDSEYADKVDTNTGGLQAVIQSLASEFLERINPELAGRAYLQEQKYDLAAAAFIRWANNNNPDDWMPDYYLALTTSLRFDQLSEEARDQAKDQVDEDMALLSAWMKGQFSSAKCPDLQDNDPVSFWSRAIMILGGKEKREGRISWTAWLRINSWTTLDSRQRLQSNTRLRQRRKRDIGNWRRKIRLI